MSGIPEQLANIRTMQDVINVLMILFTNLNNQNEIYYDMFLNPVPMDLELERYDENGELTTVILPNRAKDRFSTYSGAGSPLGVVSAVPGSMYLDTSSYALYYKGYGIDSYGWIQVYSSVNSEYLTPQGDASELTNLNMNNATLGTLAVSRGGTGSGSISGLVKGNGTSAFTAAVDGIDYMGPSSMVGIICFYPIFDSNLTNYGIPNGWLRCDGGSYSRTDYPALFAKIGTKYGSNSSTTFSVPNMINRYIKGWNGTNVGVTSNGQVGKHQHSLTGSTGTGTAHTHGGGTLNLTGSFKSERSASAATGCFTGVSSSGYGLSGSGTDSTVSINCVGHWSGATASESSHTHTLSGNTNYNSVGSTDKNEVDNITLVPIIKY